MDKLLTPEIAAVIGKFFLEWGTPGVIILFLYEERRRLMEQVNLLQKKVDDSLEARIATNKEALETVKDLETTIEKMQHSQHSQQLAMIMDRNDRRAKGDV